MWRCGVILQKSLEEQAATKHFFPMIRKKFSRLKDYQSFMLCTRVTALNLETVVWNVLVVAGHTPGGICFLDETTKILFSGDACNQNLLVLGCSVRKTLEGLYHLKTYENRYERSYSGHIGFGGEPCFFSQPETILDDCIRTAEQILSGEVTGRSAAQRHALRGVWNRKT